MKILKTEVYIKMKQGISASGTIHNITSENECLCDLNILIIKVVSTEYANYHADKCCGNCKIILERKKSSEIVKDFKLIK